MTAFSALSSARYESSVFTTTWRHARPPFALMYFAHAFTPSTAPWKRPGRSGEPVSATTLTVIVVGLTPTSDPVSVVVLQMSAAVVEPVDVGVSWSPPPTFFPLLHAAPRPRR